MMNEIPNVLIFPCSNENGLEVIRALKHCKEIKLFGATSVNEKSFNSIIESIYVPNIHEKNAIDLINEVIELYSIDWIFPCHTEIFHFLTKNENILKSRIIGMKYTDYSHYMSKHDQLNILKNTVPIPVTYHSLNDVKSNVHIKPRIGYGSQGAKIVSYDELNSEVFETHCVQEILTGDEITVDCFSTKEKLTLSMARSRERIRMGTSLKSNLIEDETMSLMSVYAKGIFKTLRPYGIWFFQMKQDKHGTYKLLEIETRIAGSSGFTQTQGVNLPLLAIHYFVLKNEIETILNPISKTINRSLSIDIGLNLDQFERLYMDLDDTIIVHQKVNLDALGLIFKFRTMNKRIELITKSNERELDKYLERFGILLLFDRIVQIKEEDRKIDYMVRDNSSLYIDDSWSQLKDAINHDICGIHVSTLAYILL